MSGQWLAVRVRYGLLLTTNHRPLGTPYLYNQMRINDKS
jgi:hypothetical protein